MGCIINKHGIQIDTADMTFDNKLIAKITYEMAELGMNKNSHLQIFYNMYVRERPDFEPDRIKDLKELCDYKDRMKCEFVKRQILRHKGKILRKTENPYYILGAYLQEYEDDNEENEIRILEYRAGDDKVSNYCILESEVDTIQKILKDRIKKAPKTIEPGLK